jgi:hypothetical protein
MPKNNFFRGAFKVLKNKNKKRCILNRVILNLKNQMQFCLYEAGAAWNASFHAAQAPGKNFDAVPSPAAPIQP